MRTTSTSFRLPNHVLGRLRLLAADVGCSQSELVQTLVEVGTRDPYVRTRLKATRAAVAFLDALSDGHGRDARVEFEDEGNRTLRVRVNGEEPENIAAKVVDVEGALHPMIFVVHSQLGLQVGPIGFYDSEAGDRWEVSLASLYPA